MTYHHRQHRRRHTIHRRKNKKHTGGGVVEDVKPQMETLLQHPDARQAAMLSAVCNASTRGYCVDFGASYRELITRFFSQYSIMSPYPSTVKPIGLDSVNGFILQIEYEREGYKSYSAIKCNREQTSDNLLYEYVVGTKFINNYLTIYPCFVETYKNVYLINQGKMNILTALSKTTVPFSTIKTVFTEVDGESILSLGFARQACTMGKNNNLAIMLQHYDRFDSLHNLSLKYPYDMPNNWLQLFFVLHHMKHQYAHYDLHANNIFLYKPYEGNRFIEMHYHMGDQVVSFPTEFVVKLIDYGRNYFTTDDVSSKKLIDECCQVCTDCGEDDQGGIFIGEYGGNVGSFYYINPAVENHSIDLLSLSRLPEWLLGGSTVQYRKKFGTPHVPTSTWNGTSDNVIRNVTDALHVFWQVCPKWNSRKFYGYTTGTPNADAKYNKYMSPDWIKMGDMHIYGDGRPYEFTSTAEQPTAPTF